MANITYTITQDGDEISYTINDGVGPVGPAGPNNITTSTETDITGILKGDGANVSAAVEDTDYQGVPAEGAFVDGDKTKLDGIEAGATGDQTGAEIKSLYEAEADTNAFTDAEKTLLGNQSGINTGDEPDATTTVKGIVELATDGEALAGKVVQGNDSRLFDARTPTAHTHTASEITDFDTEVANNPTVDANTSKLAGIEAGADVTDATNVNAAGAVMESDYSPSHSVLAQQSGTGSPSAVSLGTNSLLGRASGAGTDIQGLTAAQARTLLNVEDGATADQTAAEILTAIKTVDGTGSGLDADLLDGQDSSAFATSAQGALADSAVQPGDIDTLAELNAIVTDATLIDTTDSRLSDARTPTAHTHTVEDLDFAGSTEIGADLADADEILVSDGGGNTTRRKSLVSRIWTYIKAKIESVGLASLDITGDLTVDTNTLHVDSAANEVGIGTTAPSSTLDVYKSTNGTARITLQNPSTGGSAITQLRLVTGANASADSDAFYLFNHGSTHSTHSDDVFFYKNNSNTKWKFVRGLTQVLEIDNQNGHLTTLSSGGITTNDITINSGTWNGATITGAQSFSGQVEATGQAASTDDSVMTKGLVRDFSSVWGDVYKSGNGETDTNNKLNTVYAGDRYFEFSCNTGTAAGDGQWTTFYPRTFGLPAGFGAKGQLRDSFSYKFKFDSNTTTDTDVDLWLIRGKTANATVPTASDVCFALKFAGEEDLMIAVYDGVTAHTTTIDVSTINSWFTNGSSQQEFMWTWDGNTAKVYGRYRKPAGTGDNDWSIWYTMGSLTPSGMSASTTNLSFGGLHFLQHTPITNTGYQKNFIIWDLKHTTHVIVPI